MPVRIAGGRWEGSPFRQLAVFDGRMALPFLPAGYPAPGRLKRQLPQTSDMPTFFLALPSRFLEGEAALMPSLSSSELHNPEEAPT